MYEWFVSLTWGVLTLIPQISNKVHRKYLMCCIIYGYTLCTPTYSVAWDRGYYREIRKYNHVRREFHKNKRKIILEASILLLIKIIIHLLKRTTTDLYSSTAAIA